MQCHGLCPAPEPQSQRYRLKERTEARPLYCKHKLSSRLAETPGFRASCVYSKCHTCAAGLLTASEEETPLSLNDTQTSDHPQSMKKSWAALLTAASLPPSCLQTRWPNMQAPDWARSQLHLATRKQSQTSSVSATVQQ